MHPTSPCSTERLSTERPRDLARRLLAGERLSVEEVMAQHVSEDGLLRYSFSRAWRRLPVTSALAALTLDVPMTPTLRVLCEQALRGAPASGVHLERKLRFYAAQACSRYVRERRLSVRRLIHTQLQEAAENLRPVGAELRVDWDASARPVLHLEAQVDPELADDHRWLLRQVTGRPFTRTLTPLPGGRSTLTYRGRCDSIPQGAQTLRALRFTEPFPLHTSEAYETQEDHQEAGRAGLARH